MGIRQGFIIDLPVDIRRPLTAAAERGFDFVELNMEAHFSRQSIDPERIKKAALEAELNIVVHLPYKLDIGSPHNHARAGACRELESYLDIANKLGAETAVVHADSAAQPKHWNRSTVVTALYESIQRLHKYGVQRGLTVCAENLKGPFVDVSDAPELMARTDASLCLDTGHSFVSGTDGTQQATLFREYGNRIDHVHLNDTRLDDDDEHLPVGLGQVAFEPLVTAMVETNWEGTCTHEVYRVTDAFDYLTTSKQQFDSLRDSAR